jgi:hypothetical protein
MVGIVSSKQADDGVIVVWKESGQVRDRTFTNQELSDMKIDADDLPARPMLYKITMELNRYRIKR